MKRKIYAMRLFQPRTESYEGCFVKMISNIKFINNSVYSLEENYMNFQNIYMFFLT